MDENSLLFCGHGEQMFTVFLCSVKKKSFFYPTPTAVLAWLGQNLGIWVLLYISQFQFPEPPSARLSSPASVCRRGPLTEVCYVRPSSSPCSWSWPFLFETSIPSAELCFFLPLPVDLPLASPATPCQLCLSVLLCCVCLVSEVSSWFAFSMRESDFFWHSVK